MSNRSMLYPLTFRPIFKERLWGSRTLQTLYGKVLPTDLPIGESWEIVDRPEDISVIDRGPLAGTSLHELIEEDPIGVMGPIPLADGRFPLLIKLLDARDTLSLQVHPPEDKAAALGGEPKTEMWYLAETEPGAELFVGLRRGVTLQEFQEKLRTGTVAECFHRVRVQPGDAMFVPSGRVHAVGAGSVIFEVQQNSDTTYRVFDWNRVGPDGKGRALHLDESLEAIDFNDFEPGLVSTRFAGPPGAEVRRLVSCGHFDVAVQRLGAGMHLETGRALEILGVVRGAIEVRHETGNVPIRAGQFCLLPASLEEVTVAAQQPSEFLVIHPR